MALATCNFPETLPSYGYKLGCRCDRCTRYKSEQNKQYRTENGERLAEERTEKRSRRKRITTAIKLAIGCIECGYHEHSSALHFDHVNPDTKLFSIANSRIVMGDIMKLLDEVEKCQVLCANCHAIKTWET